MKSDASATFQRAPVNCFWEITEACNLRCIHCELEAGPRDRDELSTEEALAFVDALAQEGGRVVNLTGGEPFVRSDWAVIAKRLIERGLAVNIITNGTLLDEARLTQLMDAGVTGVSVSIDGTREVNDAIRVSPVRDAPSRYDSAIAALERLGDFSIKRAVITQIHKRNIKELDQMFERFVSLGIDVWQVQLALPLGRLLRIQYDYLIDPSDIPDLQTKLAGFIQDGRIAIAVGDNIGYYGPFEPLLRGSLAGRANFWRGCLAGIRVVGIRSNGDVKGCPSFPPAFVSGNIREEPFSEIWNDEKRFIYNTRWREDQLEGACARCPFGRICRAGCTSMAFAVTGTIFDNPYCYQPVQKR